MLSCNVNDSKILAKIQCIAVALYGNKELRLMQMKNAKWTSNWNESEKEINLQGKRPDTTKQYCFEFQGDLIDIMQYLSKDFQNKEP